MAALGVPEHLPHQTWKAPLRHELQIPGYLGAGTFPSHLTSFSISPFLTHANDGGLLGCPALAFQHTSPRAKRHDTKLKIRSFCHVKEWPWPSRYDAKQRFLFFILLSIYTLYKPKTLLSSVEEREFGHPHAGPRFPGAVSSLKRRLRPSHFSPLTPSFMKKPPVPPCLPGKCNDRR